jgi:hypothetical protein
VTDGDGEGRDGASIAGGVENGVAIAEDDGGGIGTPAEGTVGSDPLIGIGGRESFVVVVGAAGTVEGGVIAEAALFERLEVEDVGEGVPGAGGGDGHGEGAVVFLAVLLEAGADEAHVGGAGGIERLVADGVDEGIEDADGDEEDGGDGDEVGDADEARAAARLLGGGEGEDCGLLCFSAVDASEGGVDEGAVMLGGELDGVFVEETHQREDALGAGGVLGGHGGEGSPIEGSLGEEIEDALIFPREDGGLIRVGILRRSHVVPLLLRELAEVEAFQARAKEATAACRRLFTVPRGTSRASAIWL